MLDGYRRIEQSMKLVEECSTPEEFADFRRAVGKVTLAILHEILEPVYERNPALRAAKLKLVLNKKKQIV